MQRKDTKNPGFNWAACVKFPTHELDVTKKLTK